MTPRNLSDAELARVRASAENGVYLSILAVRHSIGVLRLRWIAKRDGWNLPKARMPSEMRPPKVKIRGVKARAEAEKQRRREDEERQRALYGPYLDDVHFLRTRDFGIHFERDGFRLGNQLVDGEHIQRVAARERRLMGVGA